jgi:hypothetical protein
MSKSYGRLPSELLRIEDEWAAWQFDRAVWYAGIKHEVSAANNPVTGSMSKSQLLKEQIATGQARFGSLAGKARKMKVPESGVW